VAPAASPTALIEQLLVDPSLSAQITRVIQAAAKRRA
jgi:hypothetical protein